MSAFSMTFLTKYWLTFVSPTACLTKALFGILFVVGLVGCSTVGDERLTQEERRAGTFRFGGLAPGYRTDLSLWFSHAERQPSVGDGLVSYLIYNPSPQVSLAVAGFEAGRLRQFDLRYYDGEGIFTLRRAGGWKGLRERLIRLFGEPTRSGARVPIRTNQRGLDARYAVANDEWDFPNVRRRINFVAMADKLLINSAAHKGPFHAERLVQQNSVLPAKPADCVMIGMGVPTQHPHRHIVIGRPLDGTARKIPAAVAIDQERKKHARGVLLAATSPLVDLRPAGVDLLHGIDNKMTQVVLGNPFSHVRRQ
jgi:hypothetical protein